MTKALYQALRPCVPRTLKVSGMFMTCAVCIFLFAQTSLQAQNYKPAIEYASRDGMWNVLGYLVRETDKQDAPLHFNWWSNLREFGVMKGTISCTVHLLKGSQEMASLVSGVVVSSVNWQFFGRRMVLPKSRGAKNLTLSRLTAEDGEYRLVLKANDKPVKTYRVLVKNGTVQRLPFCKLNYEPHAYFMSPRMIDTSSGSGSSYRMLDAYWVQRVKE